MEVVSLVTQTHKNFPIPKGLIVLVITRQMKKALSSQGRDKRSK